MRTKRKTRRVSRKENTGAIEKAKKTAVPPALRGVRPCDFERFERVLSIARLRRAGLTSRAIGETLGISLSSVKRGLADMRIVSLERLTLNIEKDINEDLDTMIDDNRKLEAALARNPSPRDVALIVRTRVELLRFKDEYLRKLGARRQPRQTVVDENELQRLKKLSDEDAEMEYRHMMRMMLEGAGLDWKKYLTEEEKQRRLLEAGGGSEEGEKDPDEGEPNRRK